MNNLKTTLYSLAFSILATACVSEGSDKPNDSASDDFSLADVSLTDSVGTNDTWASATDLVSAQDAGSPTPDKPGECTLTLRAEARDAAGPCTTCTFGDYITLVGVVENTCEETLTYTSDVACLVSEFVVLNLFHESKSEYPMSCKKVALSEILEPGQTLAKTRPAGTLSAGDYKLTVQFEDLGRTKTELLFSVQ